VKMNSAESDDDLRFRLAHDRDDFNRWDAGQTLAVRTILALVADHQQGRPWTLPESFSDAFSRALISPADPALLAQVLTLPGETWLAEQMAVVDVEGIHTARRFVQRTLAERLRDQWLTIYQTLQSALSTARPHAGTGHLDALVVGQRALKNVCLDYLMQIDEPEGRALALNQFSTASNMTDQLGALAPLVNCEGPERTEALAAFYDRWRREPLVVDKWLALQATSRQPGTLNIVQQLMAHEAFSLRNPNKVRALIGAFCQANPMHFHAADAVAILFWPIRHWPERFQPPDRRPVDDRFYPLASIRSTTPARDADQLERILAAPGLSPDVYEIAAKSLGEAP
jgi:aminopeptidase N